MGHSSSLEEGEIEGGEVVEAPAPKQTARVKNEAKKPAPRGRQLNDDHRRVLPKQSQRRRRSRSRSWTPSPSTSPKRERLISNNTPHPARKSRSNGTPSKLALMRDLTAEVGLPSCLRDLNGVCKRLSEALTMASQYLDTLEVGSPIDVEFRSCITGIYFGLRALNVMSATGRGLEMEPARRVVQQAWRCREGLFTSEECRELENWRDQNRHFRALIEDCPPPKAAAPAPAPLEKKAKSIKDKVPGSNGAVGGPLPGTKDKGKGEGEGPGRVHKDRLSITELRVEKTARDESEKLQLSSSQKERALDGRNVIIADLLSAGKLCLVLDLDHTLLHSVMYSELDPKLGKWLEERAAAERMLPEDKRMLFRLDAIQMYTKLRPGVREFLRRASEKFELWIHTNGNIRYADAVVPLLDPTGAFFSGRIIAQGAERIEDMRADQPKALEHGLEAREAITAVVDDSYAVWQAHSGSLVTIERYLYFPSTRTPAAARGQTLLEKKRDEDLIAGMLMHVLARLEQMHSDVFNALSNPASAEPPHSQEEEALPAWDVRRVLSTQRKKILQGVNIVFSRVIPLEMDPKTHELWQMAEAFGAKCSTAVGPGVTHLVAADGGTEKAAAARVAGVAVVSPHWLRGCCLLWQRLDERQFPVP